MKGTWQTTHDHPGVRLAVVAVIAAVVLGSGAAVAVSAVVIAVVIIVSALLALAVIGLGALVVYRIRTERRQAPPVLLRQLPGTAAPAIEPSGPRELHQHWHFHGTDPQQLAGILHRGQRPE